MSPFPDGGSEHPEQNSSPAVQDSWTWAVCDPPNGTPQHPAYSILGGLKVGMNPGHDGPPRIKSQFLQAVHTSWPWTGPTHPAIYRRHLFCMGSP